MRNGFAVLAIRASVLASTLWFAALPAVSQNAPYRAPRAAGGQHPDLDGVWQALNTANWDLQDHSPAAGTMWETGAIGAEPAGQGVVEGGDIPYLPVALEER